MNIAILSGKGGTGKTLISVNLAATAGISTYIDCDVEEPNGHLFFKPSIDSEENVTVKIPLVDNEICDGCRKCVEFCKFNALAYIKDRLLVFEEICHSCGGCVLVCPQQALTEKEKTIGQVKIGNSDRVKVCSGIMNTGEASGVPIIKRLLQENRKDEMTFVDCPPGSACIVMESINDADYCILVAEPTLFGAHNLEMVHELVTLFKKPHGVILNKCLAGENPSEKLCIEKGIDILGKIPFDHKLGMLNSNGEIAVKQDDEYNKLFSELLEQVINKVSNRRIENSGG
ncbi:MAG TPA: 4Fe-4S binding protein [Anaerovoracaceae bacterium]|nr:4Fe-4S binding protein [Anaerovoracaceae bacterium]